MHFFLSKRKSNALKKGHQYFNVSGYIVTRFEPYVLHLTAILCNMNHNVIATVIKTCHVGAMQGNEMNTLINQCLKSNGKQIKENYDEKPST